MIKKEQAKKFQGVITALATPFYQGEVDESSLKKLVRYQLDQGVDGLVVNGTTGENPTLTFSEIQKVWQCVKAEVGGQVPLILGTGSNSTAHTIELSQQAVRWGCDGVLVVVPYYNKPPQRGLRQHFEAIANQVECPVILYNVPGRTITGLEEATVAALSHHPRIVGIKEATGNLDFYRQLKKSCVNGFVFLSGDDESVVDFVGLGGDGAISVLSNILPGVLKKTLLMARQNPGAASAEYKKYQTLIRLLFSEANPIPVKAALQMMGLFRSNELRLPLVALSEELCGKLKTEMNSVGVSL